jgi:hypothetical protein
VYVCSSWACEFVEYSDVVVLQDDDGENADGNDADDRAGRRRGRGTGSRLIKMEKKKTLR